MTEKKLYWIASYPKSGNTWLRMLLASYQYDLSKYYINSKIDDTTIDTSKGYYQMACPANVSKLSKADILHLRPTALLNKVFLNKTDKVYIKTHMANVTIDGFKLIPHFEYNKAGVCIIRDPRDVAISWANHYTASIDDSIEGFKSRKVIIGSKDNNLTSYPIAWDTFVNSWADEERFPVKVIRYEDLLADPKNTLTSVLELLDFDIEEERVEKAIKACEFSSLKKQEEEENFIEYEFIEEDKKFTFFNKGTAGTWKDILTKEQNESIIEIFGETMEKYGYEV